MRCVVVGKSGQLAVGLASTLPPEKAPVFVGKDAIDWLSPSNAKQIVEANNPTHIINASAYTLVDQAEEDLEQAFAVNENGPRVLAEIALELGIPLIHVSTDYVFNGTSPHPYTPTDQPDPLNVYGSSKLAGERAIQAVGGEFYILRTSWVFSEVGTNFVRTMYGLRHHPELSVVSDQVGRPTYAPDLASIINGLVVNEQQISPGIYHVAGGDPVSWSEFATVIFDEIRDQTKAPVPTIKPTTTSTYQAGQRDSGKVHLAARPLNGVMTHSPELLDLSVDPNWRRGITRVIQSLVDSRK
jgi:dTDP-4-dehydrorhamnose reductase